jgi:hypothetical protein
MEGARRGGTPPPKKGPGIQAATSCRHVSRASWVGRKKLVSLRVVSRTARPTFHEFGSGPGAKNGPPCRPAEHRDPTFEKTIFGFISLLPNAVRGASLRSIPSVPSVPQESEVLSSCVDLLCPDSCSLLAPFVAAPPPPDPASLSFALPAGATPHNRCAPA